MNERRLEYVDALRGIAALAVLAQHLLEYIDEDRFRGWLDLAPGVFGVVTFFYISGLVIALSVRSRPPLRSFLARRVFRIYPAYLFALLLMAGLAVTGEAALAARFSALGADGLLLNILLIQEYAQVPALLGVSWTLSLEFVWYAIFAFLFYVMHQQRLAWFLNALSLALIVVSLASMAFDFRFPAGRLGMLGAALLGYLTARWQDQAVVAVDYVRSVALFVIAVVFSQWVAFAYFTHPKITISHTLTAWLSATALFLVLTSTRTAPELLRRTGLQFIGKVSYSLYLLHMPIMLATSHLSGETQLIVVPVATLVAAWASYRWVELPGIVLGKLLDGRLAVKATDGPVPAARRRLFW